MDKKYIVYAGEVIPPSGDAQMVTAEEVAAFHGVAPRECLMINEAKDLEGLTENQIALTPLYPQKDTNARAKE
jgi:hypothetical protein